MSESIAFGRSIALYFLLGDISIQNWNFITLLNFCLRATRSHEILRVVLVLFLLMEIFQKNTNSVDENQPKEQANLGGKSSTIDHIHSPRQYFLINAYIICLQDFNILFVFKNDSPFHYSLKQNIIPDSLPDSGLGLIISSKQL